MTYIMAFAGLSIILLWSSHSVPNFRYFLWRAKPKEEITIYFVAYPLVMWCCLNWIACSMYESFHMMTNKYYHFDGVVYVYSILFVCAREIWFAAKCCASTVRQTQRPRLWFCHRLKYINMVYAMLYVHYIACICIIAMYFSYIVYTMLCVLACKNPAYTIDHKYPLHRKSSTKKCRDDTK